MVPSSLKSAPKINKESEIIEKIRTNTYQKLILLELVRYKKDKINNETTL